FSIELIGPAVSILQEVCAHVRNGYVINKDYPFNLFPNGNLSLMVVLGEPDKLAFTKAQESTDISLQQEEARYRRDVEEAAKRQLEQAKREELERQVAEAVAASEKAIAKLRREAAAELAKLK
ncbi:hypothetical protein, partial [Massilia alkalitolerans]|uniref:hypothetical protein n=1 Tax=Massilia alkalitolerans TaxID=286638 RepID=UPI0028AA6FAD